MEIILDELQKNNVDIDMRTLSHHVNYLLDKHGDIYQLIVSRCPDLVTIVLGCSLLTYNIQHDNNYKSENTFQHDT